MSESTHDGSSGGAERGDHPLCAAWQRAWAASVPTVAEQWADADCTFVPFDSSAIVAGRDEVVAHFVERAARMRLVDASWYIAASWVDGAVHTVVAELLMTTAPVGGGPRERRALRFLAAGEWVHGAWRLRHVSEAMPAVLLEAIAGYEREARDASATREGPP